jgi:hypothetical protein
MGGARSTHGRDRCTQYILLKSNGRDHLEDLDVDWRIILKWILGKQAGKLWTECIWLRIGISGGLL